MKDKFNTWTTGKLWDKSTTVKDVQDFIEDKIEGGTILSNNLYVAIEDRNQESLLKVTYN